MEYVRLGNSGLKISKVIFGAMSLGDPSNMMQWVVPEDEALPIVKRAYDRGINTWDTANIYSSGSSERILGRALREYNIPREKVVIMTKCYGGVPDDTQANEMNDAELFQFMAVNDGQAVNQVGLSRKNIIASVDASIARLGTYIDVLQIHRLDRETPREEIMRTLNGLVESGKVRYIGASSMYAWELQALQNIAKQNGWHQFISFQNYHSLLYREDEREVFGYCKDAGIGMIPFSPLARGLLTRPYSDTPTLRQKTDVHSDLLIGKTTSADVEIIGRVEELAQKKGVSMTAIAVAWSVSKGVNPILGLSSVERVDQAADCVSLMSKGLLTEEDVKFLDELYVAKTMIVPL